MRRIPQLDGIRGLAILLVLLWHYLPSILVPPSFSFLSALRHALSLTWCGVDLFFVLSGFLITGILLDNRNTTNYFRVFYLRRTCRIFPLYFLLLGLFLAFSTTSHATQPAFEWLSGHRLPLWSYATFTQNILMGLKGHFGPHWLGVTWSLAVEEQFYLLVPLLVYFLPRRLLLVFFLLGILLAPLLRYADPGFHSYLYTPWRSDSILSGACLALLVRWDPFLAWIKRHPGLLRALFLLLLMGAGALTVHPGIFGVFNHFWLGALFSLLLLLAWMNADRNLSRMLQWPVLIWLGKLSYGIYMFHEAINGLLHGFIRHQPPQIRSLEDAALTGLALVLTLLAALLSHRFLESPFLRLGQRCQYQPRTPLPAITPPLSSPA